MNNKSCRDRFKEIFDELVKQLEEIRKRGKTNDTNKQKSRNYD